MPPVAKVFISYRRAPSAMLATLLHEKLKPHNIDAYVDTRRVDGGGPFPNRLLNAIEDSDLFVCLVADATFDSDWVRTEIEFAYSQGKPLIPVFQESYQPLAKPPTESINALLQSDGIHVLDVKNLYVDQAITDLARMIKTTLGIVVPRPRDTTEMSARTFNMRPRPSQSRWLWPLSALLILLIGFAVFQYVNQPMLPTSVTETPGEIAPPTDTAPATATCAPSSNSFVLVISNNGIVHTEPSSASPVMGVMEAGQRILATSITQDGSFYRISYHNQEAWINTIWVREVEGSRIIVRVNGIVRSEPSSDSPVIGAVESGQEFAITDVTADGEYYGVNFNGQVGWISALWVTLDAGDFSAVPVVESGEC
jgi:uncharacterized protein YraI